MYYHPLIGIIIFFSAIIFSFLLGKLAYKKYLNRDAIDSLELKKNSSGKVSSPPKGEITAPDAPWLKK